MATPRILNLSSSFLRRAHRRTFGFLPHSLQILRFSSTPLPPRRLSSTPLPRPLPNFRYYSAAAAPDSPVADTEEISVDSPVSVIEDTTDVSPGTSATHPWPEWGAFVDKLNSKGYFAADLAPGEGVDNAKGGDGRLAAVAAESYATMEQNRLKNACLKFGRERFDILRSLPKEDIQAIVECGCPNLYRKIVNSAKRLRAFLTLDEGNVCNGCNLKDSCDKAYIIPNEDEAARTVDVVRILFTYAINPGDLSSENTPVKMQVQESARRLLSELIKLSDTTIDRDLPKPDVQFPRQKKSSHKVVEKRKSEPIEMKKGDWLCPKCNYMNFARNTRCLECKEEGPKRVDFDAAVMKLGDWTCPSCQFMNFARNKTCKRCQESHQRELNPGEWECPSCNYVNFVRNRACRKCDCARPSDDKRNSFDDHAWRKPNMFSRNSSFKFEATVDEVGDDEDDRILPLEENNRSVTSKRANFAERSSRPGEWDCPSCNFLNFARNKVCKKCNNARPNGDGHFDERARSKLKSSISSTTFNFGDGEDDDEDEILPFRNGKRGISAEAFPKAGDWDCPSLTDMSGSCRCEFANFSRNKVCKKCKCARPNQFDDRRKQKSSNTSTSSKFSDLQSVRPPPSLVISNFSDDDEFFDDFDGDSDEEDEILPVENRKKRSIGSKRATSSLED